MDNLNNNPWNSDIPVSYSDTWLGSNICLEYINKKITGNNQQWLDYVIQKYILPIINTVNESNQSCTCLILGSSEGRIELKLCEDGFLGRIVASDIAEKALLRAKKKIALKGYSNVEHVKADLNTYDFNEKFDFIIAEGVLHHIKNIGHCLKMIKSNLKPNGKMFMVEFEGPFRFQLSDLQVRWINAALNVLPKELRPYPNVHFPQALNEKFKFPATLEENSRVFYVSPSEESIITFDPSEAYSGQEIKKLVPLLFKIIERKGFGGTLMSYMTGHFDFKRTNNDSFAASWCKILLNIEDTLINNGILDDEYVFYVVE